MRWRAPRFGRSFGAQRIMATIRLGKIDPGDCDRSIGDLDFFGNLSISRNHNAESTDTLVVEGWVHEYALRIAAKEFKTNQLQAPFYDRRTC